jgi:putative ABC transport system permease protein
LAEWPVEIAPHTVLLAIAAAAATGILFGFLPARRAGQLNPIDALRSE